MMQKLSCKPDLDHSDIENDEVESNDNDNDSEYDLCDNKTEDYSRALKPLVATNPILCNSTMLEQVKDAAQFIQPGLFFMQEQFNKLVDAMPSMETVSSFVKDALLEPEPITNQSTIATSEEIVISPAETTEVQESQEEEKIEEPAAKQSKRKKNRR